MGGGNVHVVETKLEWDQKLKEAGSKPVSRMSSLSTHPNAHEKQESIFPDFVAFSTVTERLGVVTRLCPCF